MNAEGQSQDTPSLKGVEVIRAQVKLLPPGPGVYRMIGDDDQLLYVGKARNLRRRVASYAKLTGQSRRILRMIQQTRRMEFVTTHTEAEALLLEANLIKRLKPRFNIVLRDDKSFPHILITGDHEFPRIMKHRGARRVAGEYFGPFASASAVNETLSWLQRVFPLRTCSDAEFSSRSRPCLQYQIKRCAGPCVGRIGAGEYAGLVAEIRDFLSGKSRQLQERLRQRMEEAAARLDFEAAAVYRDRIQAMAQIQAHQGINLAAMPDADVFAVAADGGQACVQVFFFRGGQNFGNRAYYPVPGREDSPEKILAAFIGQFYDSRPAPGHILVSHEPEQMALIAEALSQKYGRRIRIVRPRRGARREAVDHAAENAARALQRRQSQMATQRELLEKLGALLGMEAAPKRIEVYDNSHLGGTGQIGAMIVAGPEGFEKSAYRKFTIRDAGTVPGDDYAMMREVMRRRFTRLAREDPERRGEGSRIAGHWPDLVLLDGGAGQLAAAGEVLAELGIGHVALASVAKGPERNAGREQIFLPGREPFMLPPRDPLLYFIQRLRDEAHRFAIGAQRAKRRQAMGRNALDEIPGIGAGRKKALLGAFGSARAVARAGVSDLARVPGISRRLAQSIYDHFQGEG